MADLTAEAVLVVFAQLDQRRWGRRGQLVAVVASHTLGSRNRYFAPIGLSVFARATGLSLGGVGKLLADLVARGVLERDPGAGRAPDAWRLGEPVWEWDAPWSVGQAEVRLAVGLATGELELAAGEGFHGERRVARTDAVARAAWGARNAAGARASKGRAQDSGFARSKEARATEPPRAPHGGARNASPASTSMGRAQDRGGRGPDTASCVLEGELPPYPPGRPGAEGGSELRSRGAGAAQRVVDGVQAVEDVIAEVCGPGARLWGAPLAELERRLAEGADLELILAAMRACPGTDGPYQRWRAATRALRLGHLPERPREAVGRAYQPAAVDLPALDELDPAAAAEAIAQARALLRRDASEDSGPAAWENHA